MNKGGYLLRFVDVVLILLFGFIVISDLDEDSQIILPSSTETEFIETDMEEILYIGITKDGQFIDERQNRLIPDQMTLVDYIRRMKNRQGDLFKVRIRANYDTPAMYAIQVAQICDDLEVKKAIDVRLTSR